MTHWVEPMGEHIRLQHDAERFRTDALRTRIMTLHTFCGVAESQLMLHLVDDARLSLEKIQQAKSKIERHLRDPHHALPSASGTELWRMLGRVRPRIDELESSIAAEDKHRQTGERTGKQMGEVITH